MKLARTHLFKNDFLKLPENIRFLFLIEGDTYVLLRCGKHDEFFK